MHHRLFLMLLLLLSLGVTGCVPSREEADRKLSAACAASITATFTDPKDHMDVQKADYSFEKSYDGAKLRVVTLKAKYTYNDGAAEDKTYICTYAEDWSLFGYLPEFYNLQRDELKYGNVEGVITGDANILIKINDVTQKALN